MYNIYQFKRKLKENLNLLNKNHLFRYLANKASMKLKLKHWNRCELSLNLSTKGWPTMVYGKRNISLDLNTQIKFNLLIRDWKFSVKWEQNSLWGYKYVRVQKLNYRCQRLSQSTSGMGSVGTVVKINYCTIKTHVKTRKSKQTLATKENEVWIEISFYKCIYFKTFILSINIERSKHWGWLTTACTTVTQSGHENSK